MNAFLVPVVEVFLFTVGSAGDELSEDPVDESHDPGVFGEGVSSLLVGGFPVEFGMIESDEELGFDEAVLESAEADIILNEGDSGLRAEGSVLLIGGGRALYVEQAEIEEIVTVLIREDILQLSDVFEE
jgi:hypothetical protein